MDRAPRPKLSFTAATHRGSDGHDGAAEGDGARGRAVATSGIADDPLIATPRPAPARGSPITATANRRGGDGRDGGLNVTSTRPPPIR